MELSEWNLQIVGLHEEGWEGKACMELVAGECRELELRGRWQGVSTEQPALLPQIP
jgi:hypothetical protein